MTVPELFEAILPPIVGATVVTLVLAPLLRVWAVHIGLVDRPDHGHKRHQRPVPTVGGIILLPAQVVAIEVAIAVNATVAAELGAIRGWLYGGGAIVMAVGVVDDFRPLGPTLKIVAQLLAGACLLAAGLVVDRLWLPFAGEVMIGAAGIVVTLVWVVVLCNAVNFIDGVDGLASGVSLIAAVTLGVIAGLYANPGQLVVTSALVGFTSAFLVFNRPPARLFLGDSGSMQLGYFFAIVSLLVPFKSFTAAALYLPLIALALPLLDVLASVARRGLSGHPLWRGDRYHLFHLLSRLGWSERRILVLFYALGIVFGGLTIAMYFGDRRVVSLLLGLFMVVVLAATPILLRLLRRRRGRRTPREHG